MKQSFSLPRSGCSVRLPVMSRLESHPQARDRSAVNILRTFRATDFSVSLSDYRDGLIQKWHSHHEPILILLLSGYTREQVQKRDLVAGPLDLGIKPAGIRHQDHFWPSGVRALRIVLSHRLLTELETCFPIMNNWNWLRGSDAVRPLLKTVRMLLEKSKDAEIEEGLYDSVAAILPRANDYTTSNPPHWLSQARDYLDAYYATGVRLQHLANHVQVHPVYFARMFRRFFGCSVGQHVKTMQLRAAAALLGDRRNNIARVAYDTQFSDQAHMTRAFAKKYSLTPGQFRDLL